MINSITFPKQGKGYIYKKYDPPRDEPNKDDWRYREHKFSTKRGSYRVFNKKKYQQEHDYWEQEVQFYNEHKDHYVNAGAANNLIDHTFYFQPGINFIFGPNGSGKTTILRALAGNAIIDDGFSHLIKPADLFSVRQFDEELQLTHIQTYIDRLRMNSCSVDWSGNPIYYDNFANRQTYGELGNLVGSALKSFEEEISWHLNSKRISSGQRTTYLLNNIISYLSTPMSLKQIIEPQVQSHCNDTWNNCFRLCLKYFEQLPDYDKTSPLTLIFDEMDKSLDIETVIKLYVEYLPKLVEEFNCQIITVSHSPLLTTPYFRNNPMYNIIDLDQEYTSVVEKKMNKLYDKNNSSH